MIEEGRETALFHKLLNNLICARVRVNRTHTHFIYIMFRTEFTPFGKRRPKNIN